MKYIQKTIIATALIIVSAVQSAPSAPRIFNPDALNEEQKTKIQPIYKAFCEKQFAKAKKKAIFFGLPSAVVSGFLLSKVNYLTRFNLPVCLSLGSIAGFCSGASVIYAIRLFEAGFDLNHAKSLKQLNDDLYQQMGNPKVIRKPYKDVSAQDWIVETKNYQGAPIDLTDPEIIQTVLDGNAQYATIQAPSEHSHFERYENGIRLA